MRLGLIFAAIFLVLLSNAYAQEEQAPGEGRCASIQIPGGFKCIEGSMGVTVYSPEQLNAVFAGYEEDEGTLLVKYKLPRSEAAINLGYLYGTVIYDNAGKKLTLINGGFFKSIESNEPEEGDSMFFSNEPEAMTFGDFSGEEASKPAKEIRINASKIEAYTERLPTLVFAAKQGIYRQYDYSAICREEECLLSALISPEDAYLNTTGRIVIIRTGYIPEYLQGGDESFEFINIQNLNMIRIYDTDFIKFSAHAGDDGQFEKVKVASASRDSLFFRTDLLGEYYDLFQDESDAVATLPERASMGFLGAGDAGKTMKVQFIEQSPLPGSADKYGMYFTIKGGAGNNVNVMADNSSFGECKRSAPSLGMGACVFRHAGRTSIKPDTPSVPVNIEIIYPAAGILTPDENLIIEGFENTGSITLKRANIGAQIVFSKEDITVENGNWFDIEVSFSAKVYNPEIWAYDTLECNAVLKQCKLNGVQVSGFEELHPRVCRRDSECGEGMICGCEEEKRNGVCRPGGHCIKKAVCYEMQELNQQTDSENAIDVLIIGEGYNSAADFRADAKKAIEPDITQGGLFSVSPFKENKNKFKFYTIPFTSRGPVFSRKSGEDMVESGRWINYYKKQCGNADQAIILSKGSFRAYAYFDAVAYIPSPQTPYIIPHEFGHSFGQLSDEYWNEVSGEGNAKEPNCLTSEAKARQIWNRVLGTGNEQMVEDMIQNAKSWNAGEDKSLKGCGGDCDSRCVSYFRPSRNSIMKQQGISLPGGTSYNNVSLKWLEGRLNEYG